MFIAECSKNKAEFARLVEQKRDFAHLTTKQRDVGRRRYYGQAKRVHINRASGGNRYHCIIDGNSDADPEKGKGCSQANQLWESIEAMGNGYTNVHRGQ
jgi:hypothetical protein